MASMGRCERHIVGQQRHRRPDVRRCVWQPPVRLPTRLVFAYLMAMKSKTPTISQRKKNASSLVVLCPPLFAEKQNFKRQNTCDVKVVNRVSRSNYFLSAHHTLIHSLLTPMPFIYIHVHIYIYIERERFSLSLIL